MQKITPFLWFDNNAEEAVNFYTSIFENSKIGQVRRYGEAGPGPKGSVMTATFQIEGQEEVDQLWEKLSAGGETMQCGWVKDKFGVTWQIIPKALGELMGDKDPQKSQRVMQAMMKMIKIDVAGLKRAYEGKE